MATTYADFIKAHPSYVGNANTAQQPQKQKGRGGFLSSLISELGGAGGAVGGAAIGTGILPGIGTLLGAGIGGFLGGTTGRGVENKVRDNQNFFGKGGSAKSAFGEGALAGALSGAGEAFSLAKAGKAVTGSSRLLHPIENIGAGIAEKNAGRAYVGGIEGVGKGIKGGGMGLAQGATAPGVRGLGASASDDLMKTITKDFKIKAGNPEAVQRALEPKLSKLGAQLTDRYAKSNVGLGVKELNKLGTNILQKVTTQGGLDKGAEKYALEQVQRLVKSGDIKGLWQFTKDLESVSTSLGKGGTAATTNKNAVIDIIRQEVRPFLQDKVPGVASDNALYHRALDANKLLIKASKNQTGGGLVGKISTLQPVKALESKIGSGLESTGRVLAGTGGPVTKLTNQAVRQSPASLSRALSGGGQSDQSQNPQDQTLYGPQATQGGDPFQATLVGGQDSSMGDQQSPYSLQQALADIQRDPRNTDKYLSIYKTVEAATKPDKVSIKAKDALASGKQAVNILDQLQQSYNQAGGARGRLGGIASTLQGKAGLNNSVNVYNNAKTAFLSQIARTLGEKGVLTDQDIARIARALPSPGANPQEAAAQWAMIRSIIGGGVNASQSAYGAGNTTPDLSSILQMQGATGGY